MGAQYNHRSKPCPPPSMMSQYVAHVAQGGVEVRDGRSVHFLNDMPRGVVDEAL